MCSCNKHTPGILVEPKKLKASERKAFAGLIGTSVHGATLGLKKSKGSGYGAFSAELFEYSSG